jgi:sec-independent protein translocase protein TatA
MFMNLGYTEMMMFGVIAILLFGSRLPEVARNVGRGYGELRKSMSDFQREFSKIESYEPPKKNRAIDSSAEEEIVVEQSSAPKFAPPPSDDE